MYKPYVSDNESSYSSGSRTSSGFSEAGVESGLESEVESETVEDGRMDGMSQWIEATREALSRQYTTNQTMLPAMGTALPPSQLPGEEEEHGQDLHNTVLNFVEKRYTSVVMVNSLDRDQQIYPLPTQARLKLPRVYKNVERIDIVQIKFFCGLYEISTANKNSYMLVNDISGGPLDLSGAHLVTIPNGTYTLQQLITALAAVLNTTASSPNSYTVSYSPTTGRLTIAGTRPFTIFFKSGLPVFNQNLYSEWGLGWNLGWGGQPTDLSGSNTYTTDHWFRLNQDYIYLQLNETEHMNEIDHTSLENTAVVQDSTGQVAHYFGKLLLNNFGCWAQTFVEAPKTFKPVLGRLERLDFLWTNRLGQVLAGPDAASCDWHMALRITEVVEVASATSSLGL